MDIYFCDECGNRVTDLDLRAGKGMRRNHDTICPGCIDQGLAKSWLDRSQHRSNGHAPAAPATTAPPPPPPPGLIDAARDRARTTPDEPPPRPKPAPPPLPRRNGPDTEAIAAKPPPPTFADDFAAAGGGLGALAASGTGAPSSLETPAPSIPNESLDPDDGLVPSSAAAPEAKPDSPFAYTPPDENRPGKVETAEIPVPDPPEEKPAKTASGRQATRRPSTAGGNGTSRRTPRPATGRRPAPALGSPKLLLFSLASCALIAVIFFVVVMPKINPVKQVKAEVITNEPLKHLERAVAEARQACRTAAEKDDLASVKTALERGEAMKSAYYAFEKAASEWKEEDFGLQLSRMGYNDVLGLLTQMRQRRVILEQQQRP